jgi:hypothetical protein
MKVGLIAGTSRKMSEECEAEKLYSKSPLFRYALEFSKRNYDSVYVLSPKYGLLPLTTIVAPYEESLHNKQRQYFKEWLEQVVKQIKETIPQGTELFFHTGNRHRKLIPLLQGEYICHEPTKGMGIGRQLKWYKEQLG